MENMKKYAGNMKEYKENMKKYEKYEGICGNMEEYVGNMKEYEEMKEYPLLYKLWDLEKFRDLPLCIVFGTWKNAELSLPPFPL